MPRHAADYRSMLWMFGFAPALLIAQYANPDWVPYLAWLSFYFGVSAAVITHNHIHTPTFKARWANSFFNSWLSIFYGFPTFAWIPTHNQNHHKLVNKPGDATITWRITNRHHVLVALTYFFVSAYYQKDPTDQFIKKAKANNPKLFRRIVYEYAFWATAHIGLLSLAIFLHGAKLGLFVWAFSSGLPCLFALWTVHLFNYEQHVHADPWDDYNHSRNFTGKLLNFFLFNNGYHWAHHEQAGLHWSKLPQKFAEGADKIDPRLNEANLFWYFFRQYVLGTFIPSFGSKQIGRAPFDVKGTLDVSADDVEAVTSNQARQVS